MKKKILIGCILTVFTLIAISYATAANNNKDIERKESPIYVIRASRAIQKKIVTIIYNIKTNFLKEKIFWIPFNVIHFESNPSDLGSIYTGMKCTNWCNPTECNPTECGGITSCYCTKNDNC